MSVSRILFPDKSQDGSHLSRHSITAVIQRSTRRFSGRTTLSEGEPCRNLLLDLAPSGVCHVPTKACMYADRDLFRDLRNYFRSGRLLPCLFTLARRMQIYLHYGKRYFFCGTFRVPKNSIPRELPGTLFYGVRTFLPHISGGNCPT